MPDTRKRKESDKIYANRIKEILEKKKMIPQELSDITGLDAAHLSRIISGKRKSLALVTAFRIAQALDSKVEEVFIFRRPAVERKFEEEGD